MALSRQMSTYKKKMRMHISKSMSIAKVWDIAGPIVSEQIAGSTYLPIPYLVDTKAYRIGHIFVQEPTDVQCFCAVPMLKVLGPIQDFLKQGKSDDKWLSKDLNAIKSTDDHMNFLVEIENGKNVLRFRAFDYYFLDMGSDMSAKGQVTIDRSSHEDLSRVEWFGLITGVIAANSWEMFSARGQRERSFYIGEKSNTILFKYEICKTDDNGNVYDTTTEKIECRWLPLQEDHLDGLPLSEFVSQSNKG
ncbi:PREDICTED: uncharacterized protein LOC107189552 [Dufourea novaeangliae]|uniref:uncharacterized protein LOC107189552 n=1 Tax=Dufourea novaeangliae TaxID=178035 RepID=UPI00076797AC|nr:PREDICTED: uncharacterized protein LOC107189552 [Dufourea novaeangliae]